MKKRELIGDFLIGGCIGKTLMEFCGIVTELVTGEADQELVSRLLGLVIIFLIGGII